MKKLLSPNKLNAAGAKRLAEKLCHLVATDPEVAACAGVVTAHEAWALSGDRVRARFTALLPDGSYWHFRRTVSFVLPSEQRIPYRSWMIVLRPTWYGFGYQLLDETETPILESAEDLATTHSATEKAQREINRLLTERVLHELETIAPLKKAPRKCKTLPPLSVLTVKTASRPRRSHK